jgi:3'-phosphoadenosine 5'-phosphosulfate sulfotransferase (PAPS reductase)/FAD synthetase
MTDPYRIEGPALISFSGGRTSAYLLKHVLDAYGGTLPANVLACFANTGKEMPQTLDFVRDCGQRWNVSIVWLEYDPAGETQRKFRVVDHASASRQGEPYEALLRERKYLPNPVTRFCTTTLLCGGPHNKVYVAILLMWRPVTMLGGFRIFPGGNAT